MKFKPSKESMLSIGVAVGGIALAILKGKDEENKKKKEKEALFQEFSERLSKKED